MQEQLEKTYQEWLVVAEQACQKMEASGIAIVKVPVEVQKLIDWCRERNVPVDGKARAQYIVEFIWLASARHQTVLRAPREDSKPASIDRSASARVA